MTLRPAPKYLNPQQACAILADDLRNEHLHAEWKLDAAYQYLHGMFGDDALQRCDLCGETQTRRDGIQRDWTQHGWKWTCTTCSEPTQDSAA